MPQGRSTRSTEQSMESGQRCWLKVGTGEAVRYVTRYTLHYFFVALFPLPSVSGYNLGAALNTSNEHEHPFSFFFLLALLERMVSLLTRHKQANSLCTKKLLSSVNTPRNQRKHTPCLTFRVPAGGAKGTLVGLTQWIRTPPWWIRIYMYTHTYIYT